MWFTAACPRRPRSPDRPPAAWFSVAVTSHLPSPTESHGANLVPLCGVQAESKDEAEKPSESAEKSDKADGGEKVKKEGAEPSERPEAEAEGAEAKTASATGNRRAARSVETF